MIPQIDIVTGELDLSITTPARYAALHHPPARQLCYIYKKQKLGLNYIKTCKTQSHTMKHVHAAENVNMIVGPTLISKKVSNRCAELWGQNISSVVERLSQTIDNALLISSYYEKLLEIKTRALFMLLKYDATIQLASFPLILRIKFCL